MSILGNVLAGASGNQGYEIERSLRFNDDDSAYLNRTPSSAGNRKTWTWSGWLKRGTLGSAQKFFAADDNAGSATYLLLEFQSDDNLRALAGTEGSSATLIKETTMVFRDPSAWYHIVFKFDAVNTSAVWYINGEEITDLNTSTNPSNQDYQINATTQHFLGKVGSSVVSDGDHFDGYMAEVNFVDGQALDASYFGETDPVTGAWIPKKYSGTYGTNGFYLNFSDNSGVTATTLGKDSSGNSNNWTPNNFSVTAGTGNDSLEDTPTNNWCTINPLDGPTSTTLIYSEGNLTSESTSNSARNMVNGTFGVTSGKWYWELTVDNSNGRCIVGVALADATRNDYLGVDDSGWGIYQLNGDKYHNGTGTSYGSAWTTAGDVVQIALDADNSKIWFGKNGTYFDSGDPAAGTDAAYTNVTGGALFPSVGDGSAGGDYKATYNFGQRAFAYTPPTGFLALNVKNLPVPTVKNGTEYFNTVVWSGDGSSPRAITGVGFQPDFIWTKPRSTADDHLLMDVIRGTGNLKWLATNSTSAEGIAFNNGNVTSLDSDGFTIGTTGGTNQLNATSRAPVAWNWKAGGSGSANTDGTISSTVSVNADAGFSIVKYTGNGTDAGSNTVTVGHGLGVKPEFIITKKMTSGTDYGWSCWHKDLGAGYGIWLHLTNARNPAMWDGDSNHSSTVFSPADSAYNNVSGSDYINYLFTSVEGYSKIGSYTGNGSTDGTFVYTGFRPAVIITKRFDSTGSWYMFDNTRATYNETEPYVLANAANVEATDLGWDLLSNGFKHRTSYIEQNTSGGSYLFIAFAETPFKYANAR